MTRWKIIINDNKDVSSRRNLIDSLSSAYRPHIEIKNTCTRAITYTVKQMYKYNNLNSQTHVQVQ